LKHFIADLIRSPLIRRCCVVEIFHCYLEDVELLKYLIADLILERISLHLLEEDGI